MALIVLFMVAFVSACGGGGGGGGSSSSVTAPSAERISFAGAGNLGIFDPSLARDPASARIWMSYSSVNSSVYHLPTQYWTVSIRLAFSDDNGVTWQDGGIAVAPALETIVGPMAENHPLGSIPAGSEGIWQNETSSLIYDALAPPAQRWKLIWFQYLHVDTTSFFADHSWIAMKTAATVAGLEAATAVKLFGGAGLQADGANTAAPVFSPIGGAPLIQLNTDLTSAVGGADLNHLDLCVFAEPGLHATASALYLSIFCADASTMPITEYLVYFRCNNPCNLSAAASWDYLGRLLTPADAVDATGDDHFQAPALVEKNGSVYLIATPVDVSVDNRYNGCRVYELTDVDSNLLRRAGGQLIEVARIDGDTATHHGACAGYSGLSGGILLSQFGTAGAADAFSIFKSQIDLP